MTQHITIPHAHAGALYHDGVFVRILDPGRYDTGPQGFFDKIKRSITVVDTRERSLVLKGQEILTADKVAIRVSILVFFKVVDAAAALHEVANYTERIYEDVQLSARRFLSSRSLDDILADRNDISDAVLKSVSDSAARFGVEILRADVKDLVFPGNLRQIMNQVLETERRAEAKLIGARKEAEAAQVTAEAEQARVRIEAETERLQALIEARTNQEKEQLRLQTELVLAEAIKNNPSILRLRELDTLASMSRSGAKFVVGLDGLRPVGLHAID